MKQFSLFLSILLAIILISSLFKMVFKSETPPNIMSKDGNLTNVVSFKYGGYQFTDTITFTEENYKFYKGLSKTSEYNEYVNEDASHLYLQNLATLLDKDAKDLGYKDNQMVEYISAFVQQSIPYISDPKTGHDYPKYPIETIIEGGDCEDKAALLAALLKVFGFNSKLCDFSNHMAVAVTGYGKESFEDNGVKYTFIESTIPISVGEVPSEDANVGFSLLDVNTTTRYTRDNTLPDNPLAQVEKDTTLPALVRVDDGTEVSNTITVNGVTIKTDGNVTVTQDGNTVTITYGN